MATEGQTAIGPNGERAVFQGGQWVVMSGGGQAQPAAPIVTPLPRSPDRVAEAESIRVAREQAAQIAAANSARAAEKAARDAAEWNATHYPDGTPKPQAAGSPTLTSAARADAIQAFTDATALEGIVADLRSKMGAGPGATTGIYGLQDYFPTAENQAFDSAAQRARGYVKRALGFTGGEGNTVAESSAIYDPYLPSSWDRDTNAGNKIAALEQLAQQARTRAVSILGGVPDANGRITPVPEGQGPSVWNANSLVAGGATPQAAGQGATTTTDAIPDAMQQENQAWLAANLGRFDPAEYADFRTALDVKYGYPADRQKHLDWGMATAERLKAGGATIGGNIPAPERPMDGGEMFRNDLVANPIGAAITNAADMGSFGGVTALAGNQMQALNEQEPWGALTGQIGGSIAGTGMLASALRNTAGRVSPSLLGGGAKSAFTRGLGTDVAYSGIYGGMTGQDPLTTAAEGGAGSLLGQGVGKALGTAIGGVNLSPAAQYLRERGVPLTLGQSIGGTAKRVEDAMTSMPVAGDMVGQRRLEGFQAFNQAAFNDAAEPINATVSTIGENGLNELFGIDGQQGLIGQAYDNATAGVQVPLDGQFWGDLQGVAAKARMLPGDHATRFERAMDNRMAPIAEAGQMTGEQYQQAMRGMRTYRAGAPRDGFEGDYRDALTGGMDALTGAMRRGGGDSVVTGLASADQAYRGAKTLQSAVRAAKNGSGSGEIQTFTPAQLNTAATQSAQKYGGRRQSADLIDAGQQVLPSTVPDSGTARRALQAGLGGAGVMGAAGGVDYATGGDYNALAKTAAVIALLTAGGSRTGQRALDTLVIRRPDAAKKLGSTLSRNKGLFGRAAIGPLIAK